MHSEALPALTLSTEIGPLDEFRKLDIDETALLSSRFQAYAAPSAWGPWVQIASYGGVVRASITYETISNTNAIGAVNYHGTGGQVTQQFNGSIEITTGNVWAVVYVCFKGTPLGTAVQGSISP